MAKYYRLKKQLLNIPKGEVFEEKFIPEVFKDWFEELKECETWSDCCNTNIIMGDNGYECVCCGRVVIKKEASQVDSKEQTESLDSTLKKKHRKETFYNDNVCFGGCDGQDCKQHTEVDYDEPLRTIDKYHLLRQESIAKAWIPKKGEEFWTWNFRYKEPNYPRYSREAPVHNIANMYVGACHPTKAACSIWGEKYAHAFENIII